MSKRLTQQELSGEPQTQAADGETKRQEQPPCTVQITAEVVSNAASSKTAKVNEAKPEASPSLCSDITDHTDTTDERAEEHRCSFSRPERLADLKELLKLIGFELTLTGEAMATQKWLDGKNNSEVALDIIMTSLAHAFHRDQTRTARIDPEAMLSLIDMIELTMWDMVADGSVSEEVLVKDLSLARASSRGDNDARAAMIALLLDSVLGIEAPAVLLDDVWLPDEGENDTGDGQVGENNLQWRIWKDGNLWKASDGNETVEAGSLDVLRDEIDARISKPTKWT